MERSSLERVALIADLSSMRSGIYSSRSGAALVIILAFMVMLLGLLMAFFSRTTAQQQISQASSNLSSADVLSRGAVESIVADLLQEIPAGSRVISYTNGSVVTTNYYPATNASMVPSISGFATNVGLENLVKVSGSSPVFSVIGTNGTTNGPTRGSTNASSSISFNGRSVSSVRWNRSLLIGRKFTNSASDFTPVDVFTNAIPKWILIARNGANPTAWNDNMRWSPTNGTTVIGRYAYAIYNEGGLLDANVAGYPPALTDPAYVPYKTGTFFADLTQIGLTGNQIKALVGWRNKASAQSSGTFPSYNLGNGSNFAAAMMAETNGHLITYQTNAVSDLRFTSRQQLIEFLKVADSSATPSALNALQSLGTFSRSLDQPSYSPDTNRPKIVHPVGDDDNVIGISTVSPLISNLLSNYRGGNDAYLDTDPIRGDINPAFLSIRVLSGFTRMDGSKAQVGEPLVKKRFPLSRLAWITHNGNPPAGVTATMIKDAFGLTWCPTMKRWAYDHGFNNGGSIYIGRLAEVSAANREPDFFELLKASLNAGSLGKAAALGNPSKWGNDSLGAGSYYQMRDKSLECQIYQIGLNLIDQADGDSYPTALWVNNPNRSDPVCTGGTYDGSTFNGSKFYGVEDLPYFHRMFFKAVADANDPPKPAVGGAPVDYGSDPASITGANFYPGTAILLGQPELWNPHDSSTWNSSTNRPTEFRVSAVSQDPDGIISIGSTAWQNFSTGQRFMTYGAHYYISSANKGNPYQITDALTIAPAGEYYFSPWCVTGLTPAASGTNFGFPPGATTLVTNITTGSVSTNFSYNTWSGNRQNEGYVNAWPDDGSYAMTDTAAAATKAPGNVVLFGTELLLSCANSNLFREPTLLGVNGLPSGSGLRAGPGNRLTQARAGVNRQPLLTGTYPGYIQDAGGTQNIGFMMMRRAIRYILITSTTPANTSFTYQVVTVNYIASESSLFTIRLQYRDAPNGPWLTYDERLIDQCRDPYNNLAAYGARDVDKGSPTRFNGAFFDYNGTASSLPSDVSSAIYYSYDPRGARFGNPMKPSYNSRYTKLVSGTKFPSPPLTAATGPTIRPNNSTLYNAMAGIPGSCNTNTLIDYGKTIGWYNLLTASAFGANAFTQPGVRMGWLVENNPAAPQINAESPQYYADADDIVRRASGAFAATNGYGASLEGIATAGRASQSRSVILNRPFRSVAEMSYAFRGSPWKNIDFSAPETGDAALLDVFSVKEAPTNGVVAGKFDLNTRQKPVLKALLSGAIKSELDGTTISSTKLSAVADAVVARTSGTNAWEGPLRNVSELAGKLIGKNVSGLPADSSVYTSTIPAGRKFGSATNDYAGNWSYTGIGAVMAQAIATNSPTDTPSGKIQHFREASMRTMASTGQCRVWNLMIDVIAQTGRYPQGVKDLSQFKVDGEKRYWLHVAIDRVTGQVLDAQMETVTE